MVEAIRQGDIPGVQLRRRQELPVGVDEAWRWLTSGELIARWLAAEATAVAGPEGSLSLAGLDERGRPYREEATTLAWEPPDRWAVSFLRLEAGWGATTRLTFELAGLPAGCELSVLQQGFEHLPLSECLTVWEAYRKRWREALERLAQALSS